MVLEWTLLQIYPRNAVPIDSPSKWTTYCMLVLDTCNVESVAVAKAVDCSPLLHLLPKWLSIQNLVIVVAWITNPTTQNLFPFVIPRCHNSLYKWTTHTEFKQLINIIRDKYNNGYKWDDFVHTTDEFSTTYHKLFDKCEHRRVSNLTMAHKINAAGCIREFG